MKILVLGGTRFFGVHMVKTLLDYGVEVTIATRGNAKDKFSDRVHRIKLDRTDILSLNGTPTFSLNCDKAKELGFHFSNIETFIYKTLDEYIAKIKEESY